MSNHPFSISNRIARLLWQLAYLLFFRYTPRCLHVWRIWILKCFGANVSLSCHIYPNAEIWAPWNLVCKANSCIGQKVIVYNQAPIYIGEQAVVSQESYLCTGTHDYTKHSFNLITKPIVIQAHAWVGARAFILPGVTVGEGCVIGACSVVTKAMPPWMVCAGHPCEPIKKRVQSRP